VVFGVDKEDDAGYFGEIVATGDGLRLFRSMVGKNLAQVAHLADVLQGRRL
jgi:hypothetical protein